MLLVVDIHVDVVVGVQAKRWRIVSLTAGGTRVPTQLISAYRRLNVELGCEVRSKCLLLSGQQYNIGS